MTLLKFINRFILQWFFIRLTKNSQDIINNFELHSFDLMQDGTMGSRGYGTIQKIQWHSIQGFILPLSGYINDKMIYLNKSQSPWYIRITPKKLKAK